MLKYKSLLLFGSLGIIFLIISKQPLNFVIPEVFTHVTQNSFITLALIVPIQFGMELNFGIVIGAMAAQALLIYTVNAGYTGIGGFLLAAALATPAAAVFGLITGAVQSRLKEKGMTGGIILSCTAVGSYTLLLSHLPSGMLQLGGSSLLAASGTGIKGTVDLKDTVKYALDTVSMLSVIEMGFYVCAAWLALTVVIKVINKQDINWRGVVEKLAAIVILYALTFIPVVENFSARGRILLLNAIELGCMGVLLWQTWRFLAGKLIYRTKFNWRKASVRCVLAVMVYVMTYIPAVFKILIQVQLPILTYVCIAGLLYLNHILVKTEACLNLSAVGADTQGPGISGVNVRRVHIAAMIFSTVMACWGQLIFLQSAGTFHTYESHITTSLCAAAALLAGGASVRKAYNRQAVLGVVLLHFLFIAAFPVSEALFGDWPVGRFYREFISCGIIAAVLVSNAWRRGVNPASK